MLFDIALYVLLGTGLAASVGFLILHRPRRFFRTVEINASWWVIIIGLLYARSVVLLGIRGARPPETWWDTAIGLGFLGAIDALLLVRFFSYVAYRRRHPEAKHPAS
ncbi:hypothetical protein ACFWB2_14750 [Streptomyces virginiae]|uniref:hypothetical protein n=1 Tax=Streptomyces TaxID=1883 RepID=UPI00093E2947|nr:hypothetical protein [Streptomyces sp. MJM1172]OKI67575.1 hypothetical protein AMK15_06305 [Streptomyces sp. MJM1172]